MIFNSQEHIADLDTACLHHFHFLASTDGKEGFRLHLQVEWSKLDYWVGLGSQG
jgi:hypothetical protein